MGARAYETLAFLQAFFPKAAQTEKAIEALAMFFYTTETLFHRVGSEFLQQAFMLLGCKISGRKELAGNYLEAAYQRVKARVDKELGRPPSSWPSQQMAGGRGQQPQGLRW